MCAERDGPARYRRTHGWGAKRAAAAGGGFELRRCVAGCAAHSSCRSRKAWRNDINVGKSCRCTRINGVTKLGVMIKALRQKLQKAKQAFEDAVRKRPRMWD